MVINVSFIDKNVKILLDKNKVRNKKLISNFNNEKKQNTSLENNDFENIDSKNVKSKDEIFINVSSKESFEKESKQLIKNSNQRELESESDLEQYSVEKLYRNHINESQKMMNNCFEVNPENNNQKIINFSIKENSESLEQFLDNVFSLEDYFSRDFLKQIKRTKKSLILPDEIIGFDSLKIPALNPLQVNSNIKLKLSVDYKDFQNLGVSFKQVNKIKPNIVFAIQLLKREVINKIIVKFKNLGFNFSSIDYYSSCLTNFYKSKLKLKKSNSIIVKVEKNHTTFLVISHGHLIFTTSLACGSEEISKNAQYKSDEHSKKMTAYKYICYEISNIDSDNSQNSETSEPVTIDKIEKEFPQTRTNLLAPVFQVRNVYCANLVNQKINEIIYFVKNSEFGLDIDSIYIDTSSHQLYEQLKSENPNFNKFEQVSFDELDIFAKVKPNNLLKFSKLKKTQNEKFSWSSLWKKTTKKA